MHCVKDCNPADPQCWFPARIESFSKDGLEVRVSWRDGDDDDSLVFLPMGSMHLREREHPTKAHHREIGRAI